jgi:hypothetical protein
MLDAFFLLFILVTLVFYPRVSRVSVPLDSTTGKYCLIHGIRYKILALVFASYVPVLLFLFFYPSRGADALDFVMFYCLVAICLLAGLHTLIGAFRSKVEFNRDCITARYAFSHSPAVQWQQIKRVSVLHRKRALQLTQNDGQFVRVNIYMLGLPTFVELARELSPSAVEGQFDEWLRKNKFSR